MTMFIEFNLRALMVTYDFYLQWLLLLHQLKNVLCDIPILLNSQLWMET